MMMSSMAQFDRRLQTLESSIVNQHQGWFYAVYQDGTRKLMRPLDAIQLCSTDDPELVCFEGECDKENGILVEVVNYIRLSQREMK